MTKQISQRLKHSPEGDSRFGNCGQCRRFWSPTGKPAVAAYKAFRKSSKRYLCDLCMDNELNGEYRFACEACDFIVIGTFNEVRSCIDVEGRKFCQSCAGAFYGQRDAKNEAISLVEKSLQSLPKKYWKWLTEKSYEDELKYKNRVRTLTWKIYCENIGILNPIGKPIGRTGQKGAYQIDHIVPVRVCCSFDIPIEIASSIHNLQVIPWLVNSKKW